MPKAQPKYLHLYEQLAARIRSGEWAPGDRLPSEPQLAEEYGVAYMTARQSIHALVKEGLVNRTHGRGTFVAEPESLDKRPSLGMLLLRNWYAIDPFYFSPLVEAFVQRADELGFQVHLADRSEPLKEQLKFTELRVRAMAMVLHDHDDLRDAESFLNQGFAVVAINRYGGSRRVPSVSPDNRGGTYEATLKLIELGHRQVAHIMGPRGNFDALERRKGVELAWKASKLPSEDLRFFEAAYTEESGYQAAKRILQSKALPTAVVCVNDLTALAAMKVFSQAGLRVPEDISVFGFGNMRLTPFFQPGLTTMQLPTPELGKKAAEALVALYRGVRLEPVRIPCPMVWRESVAPPRAQELFIP